MLRSIRPILIIAVLFGAIALYAFNCYSIFDYTLDDTYTALRYARTFVDSGWLSANPGERHHGIHDYFFVLVLAAIYRIFHDPEILPVLMKLFLISCGILTLGLPLIFKPVRLSRLAKAWYVFSLATATPYIIWSVAGFGTVLLGLLVMLLFILFHRTKSSLLALRFFLIIGVITIYTRLDFSILVAGLVSILILRSIREQAQLKLQPDLGRLKALMRALVNPATANIFAFWALPIVIIQTSIWLYYGSLLPVESSKLNAISINSFIWGLLHCLEFMVLNANLIHFTLIIFFVFIWKKAAVLTRQFLFAVGIYFIYCFSLGEIHMMLQYRQYVPFLAVFYLVSSASLTQFMELKKSVKYLKAKIIGALTVIVLLGEFFNLYYIEHKSLHLSVLTRDDPLGDTMEDNYILYEGWRNVSYFLRDNFDRGKIVLTCRLASLAPYISGLYSFDNNYLSDAKSSARYLLGIKCTCTSKRDEQRAIPGASGQVFVLNRKVCGHTSAAAVKIEHIQVSSIEPGYLKNLLANTYGPVIYWTVSKGRDGKPAIFNSRRHHGKENYMVWVVFESLFTYETFCMRKL